MSETDDASYVQQQWDANNVLNDNELQEILSQFSANQELRNLQLNLFGLSDQITDSQLLPTNIDFLAKPKHVASKEITLGKRNFQMADLPKVQTPENTLQPLSIPSTNKKQKLNKTIAKAKGGEKEVKEVAPKQTRECHNMNERQRRLKINQKIQDLKDLLPTKCSDILTNKLAILHESVEHIRNLHYYVEHLTEKNQFLEQRLASQEKELLSFRMNSFPVPSSSFPSSFPSDIPNNNELINNNNELIHEGDREITPQDISDSFPLPPTSVDVISLLNSPLPQYQRQLPSNSVISDLSSFSSLFR